MRNIRIGVLPYLMANVFLGGVVLRAWELELWPVVIVVLLLHNAITIGIAVNYKEL